MLPVVFILLLAGCLALWACGAPVWVVFLAAFAAWIAFYVVVYPKVRSYKATMGIDDRLDAVEARGWTWITLHFAGLKVIALGFLTSMVPFAGSLATWLSGQNFAIFFGPDTAQKATFYVGAVIFAMPFLSSWLHIGALRDAAASEPKG